MLHEDTFQTQTDQSSLSSHKICFKVGGNFKMIKYGTSTETVGHGKRIVGEASNFFTGLISA